MTVSPEPAAVPPAAVEGRGRRPPSTAPAPPACGTRAGYLKHGRDGTERCQPCRDAQAAYSRAYRRASGLGPRFLSRLT